MVQPFVWETLRAVGGVGVVAGTWEWLLAVLRDESRSFSYGQRCVRWAAWAWWP
jgi:hypothetical protein